MKFNKLIKSSTLDQNQISFLKQEVQNSGYDFYDFKDHNELLDLLQESLDDKYEGNDLVLDEDDFKNVIGLSYQQFDDKLEEHERQEILEDFEDAKDSDVSTLEDILDKLETSWAYYKLSDLIQALKEIKHDGSKDLGYRTDHIMDSKHKRVM